MKLRQKLAVVLASAMVVTAVPVVTSAASTNTITRPSTILEKGDSYTVATTAPAVRINFSDFTATTTSPEEFYLTLENATWNKDNTDGTVTDIVTALASDSAIADGEVEIKVVDSARKVLQVRVNAMVDDSTSVFYGNGTTAIKIPMLITLTGGAVNVAITAEGSDSTITEGKLPVANTADEVASVLVDEVKASSINKEGKIGTIVIGESYASSMKKATGNYYALVELNEADYKFDLSNETALGSYDMTTSGTTISFTSGTDYTKYAVDANFTYGFSGASNTTVNVYVANDGSDSMYVELPNNISSRSKGRIELNDLYVKATVKNPAEGNITVDISGNVAQVEDLVVAVNGDYDAKITVADNKAVEILAGETETVNFTLTETVDGTFTNGRAFSVMLENGFIIKAAVNNNKIDEDATLTNLRAAIKSITHKAGSTTNTLANTTITDVEIVDGKVVGFTFKPATAQTANALDSFTFKFNLPASVTQKGEVKVSVTSRDLEEAATAVIANVRSAVEITSEAMVLKTGLMGQEGGKITITESEAGVLNRNEQVVVYLPSVKGIAISDAKNELPEVTVTSGDAQVSDIKIIDTKNLEGKEVQALVMTIKRESKEASTIEIANFHIDTDRTVAEGSYDVQLGGEAVTSHAETVEMKDFFVIGTANTEDLVAANGLAKGTSTFVIGEDKYTINGVEKTMDAKSYIQDPGYTMIPVRYVAEAFGVSGNDILFSNGTATIFAGNRTIQLTNGSDVAVVNGAQVKMGTKVVIKEGRTYAPVGEVARLLGVSTSWDNTTKTATFTNK